jgi:nitric oxide dioxygenase
VEVIEMGCSVSVPLVELLPAYCNPKPALTPTHVADVRASWKAIVEGTAAYRARVALSPQPSAASSGGSSLSFAGPSPETTRSSSGPELAPEDNPKHPLYSPIAHFFDSFYNRLFEVAPEVRGLFKHSIKVQGRALVKMLDAALNLLQSPSTLKRALRDLALRHLRYGAEPKHYSIVGECLLFALETCLGPELWTAEVKEGWLTVFSFMMVVMLPAAYGRRRWLRPSSVSPATVIPLPMARLNSSPSVTPSSTAASYGELPRSVSVHSKPVESSAGSAFVGGPGVAPHPDTPSGTSAP